jgi:hypothetical protein
MANSFVMSRPFHCPDCERLRRPLEDKAFVVFGGESQVMFALRSSWKGKEYITPHIICLDKVTDDGMMLLTVSCGIIGCGFGIFKNSDGQRKLDCVKARKVLMTPQDYKALKDFKDTDYYLDK